MPSLTKKTEIPFATIRRIMKEQTDCFISDDAVKKVAEETLEFIIKLTEYSADITKNSNRKVIQRDTVKVACRHLK